MVEKEEYIQKFIQNLDVVLPKKDKFLELSRIAPINPKRGENFIENNQALIRTEYTGQ